LRQRRPIVAALLPVGPAAAWKRFRFLDSRIRVTHRFGFAARLLLALSAILGILVGLGAFTFRYAEGTSYLSNDPNACANCHVMWDQHASWTASSHSAVATCVDCHLPHPFVPKWLSKAENGWFHSVGFTLQNFPESIRIKPRNLRIVQNNCVACHAVATHEMLPASRSGEAVSCIHCHLDVGHAGR
jgi:cytochrome c nitrite reductase small subunit